MTTPIQTEDRMELLIALRVQLVDLKDKAEQNPTRFNEQLYQSVRKQANDLARGLELMAS